MKHLPLAVSITSSILLGCGGSGGGSSTPEPFAGVYEVTSYTKNETNCDAEGAAVTDGDSHFRLVLGSAAFPGGTGLLYQTCASASDCSGDSYQGNWYFPEKAGDQWQGRAYASAGGSSTSCSMTDTEGVATLDADGVLTMRVEVYRSGSLPIEAADDCDIDSAFFTAKRPEFACSELNVLRAKKI